MTTNTTKDGGPAFPQSHAFGGNGMSLRDYFAGQALAGLVTSNVMDCLNGKQLPDAYAAAAYCIADDMLAERDKKQETG